MSQHDLTIDNQLFPSFRGDLNNALQALGSTMLGVAAPGAPPAGMCWVDNSATPWVLKIYDGTDWIGLGAVDITTNRFSPYVGAAAFGDTDLEALRSTSIGAAAPASPLAGMQWIDSSVSPWVLRLYDGTDWIAVAAVDPAANTSLPYAGAVPMSAVGASVATAADAAAGRAALGATGGGMILDRNSVAIGGGTIDGVDIGASTPGSAVFTAVDVQYLHVQDQKAAGLSGGAFTAGAWRTRTLNTVVWNTITGASLANDTITLPAGTYYVRASAPAFFVEQNKAQLYNATDGAIVLEGTTEYAPDNPGDTTHSRSIVNGRLTIVGPTNFILRQRCAVTNASNGFGVFSNLATEVYSEIEIWRVA